MASKAVTRKPAAKAPAPEEKRKPSQEVVVPKGLQAMAEQDAGAGVSTKPEDTLVPIVRRLQSNSPQVNPQIKDKYIKGAVAGDIWLRDEQDPIIKGEDGFVFQPCGFYRDWVEWRPRKSGGGLAGRHDTLPPDAEEKVDPENGRMAYFRPNGNLVVDTRYHAGFIVINGDAFPYVIPMKSTDHTVSRQWTTAMGKRKLASGKIAPSWMYLYRFTTKSRTNAAGTWATWDIQEVGPITTEEEYTRGKDLHISITSGAKRGELDEPEQPQ
jgi:hypothetical protein